MVCRLFLSNREPGGIIQSPEVTFLHIHRSVAWTAVPSLTTAPPPPSKHSVPITVLLKFCRIQSSTWMKVYARKSLCRGIIVAVSPTVLWQREAGAHWRGESTTFTWQGLGSAAGRMATGLGHGVPGHSCSHLLDKALDQPLQPMDTSPAGGSSCTSLCRPQLPPQNGLGCKGP